MIEVDPPTRYRSRWKVAILAAAAAAAAVDAAIYALVRPRYEATAILLVETRGLTPEARERAIRTAMATLRTDLVLDIAAADHAVEKSPSRQGTDDFSRTLMETLKIENIAQTDFIRLGFESPNSGEDAAAIVNAVASSFLNSASDHRSSYRRLRAEKLQQSREEARALLESSSRDLGGLLRAKDAPGVVAPDDSTPISFTRLTADLRRSIAARLVEADLEVARAGDGPAADEAKRARNALRAMLAQPEGLPDEDEGRIPGLAADVDDATRRLEAADRAFGQLGEDDPSRPSYSFVDGASAPKAPTHDPRGALIAGASTFILLLGLALGMQPAPERRPDA